MSKNKALTFSHYGAEFLDFGKPDRVGLAEEDFEYYMKGNRND